MEYGSNRTVRIEFQSEIRNIIVTDNCLKKSVLFEYYPKGSTLTYKVNEDVYLLHADEECIYLAPHIDKYQLNLPKDLPQKNQQADVSKRKSFNAMMADVYKSKTTKGKVLGQKINNNQQNKMTPTHFLNRVVTVGWKHRQDFDAQFNFMGHTLGKKVKIMLNGNECYSIERLKTLFMNEYVNNQNRIFFDNSFVGIGNVNGEIFTKFVNDKEEPCSFWEFASPLRNKSHCLTVYLLTTAISQNQQLSLAPVIASHDCSDDSSPKSTETEETQKQSSSAESAHSRGKSAELLQMNEVKKCVSKASAETSAAFKVPSQQQSLPIFKSLDSDPYDFEAEFSRIKYSKTEKRSAEFVCSNEENPKLFRMNQINYPGKKNGEISARSSVDLHMPASIALHFNALDSNASDVRFVQFTPPNVKVPRQQRLVSVDSVLSPPDSKSSTQPNIKVQKRSSETAYSSGNSSKLSRINQFENYGSKNNRKAFSSTSVHSEISSNIRPDSFDSFSKPLYSNASDVCFVKSTHPNLKAQTQQRLVSVDSVSSSPDSKSSTQPNITVQKRTSENAYSSGNSSKVSRINQFENYGSKYNGKASSSTSVHSETSNESRSDSFDSVSKSLYTNSIDVRFVESVYSDVKNSKLSRNCYRPNANTSSVTINEMKEINSPQFSILTNREVALSNQPSEFKKPLDISQYSVPANPKVTSPNQPSKFKKPLDNQSLKEKIKKLNLSINEIQEKDLKLSNVILGQGAQGIVYKGMYLETEVAVKTVSLMKIKKDKELLKEIKLLDKVRHQNIISIMAICYSPEKFHIVMEYFISDTLYDILFDEDKNRMMDDNFKFNVALQICQAVNYLHLQEIPIIHRDIKPSNILVNDHFVTKLCDMGLGQSDIFEDSLMSTNIGSLRGTLIYMAPEVLLHGSKANEKSDIWSLACSLVELFTEERIWDFRAVMTLMNNLREKVKPNLEKVPEKMKQELSNCFDYDPSNRPFVSTLLKLIRETIEKYQASRFVCCN